MRICIISSSYPNEDGVGNTFVEQLVNEWAKQGHQCVVISPLNTYGNNDALSYKEYEVKELGAGRSVTVYRPRFWNRNIPFIPISTNKFFAQRVLEKTIRKHNIKFDVFYCHFFVSGTIAWHFAHSNNIPLFVATGESKIREHFQKTCYSFTWEKFRKDTNGVICVSTKNLEECVSLSYADKDKCRVFPNGANLNLFRPLDRKTCRQKLGFNDSDFITITVGEFSDRKGQKRIIQAIDSLGEASIKSIFIGQGGVLPNRDYILFKGRVKHDDLPLYLSAADVFVLPTLREGCCNAIIEAMACGLPIISSDRKFNHDVLNPQNSIMVDPEAPDEIAKAINVLLKDEKRKCDLASGSLDSSKRLSIEVRAQNIMNFIMQTI